MRKHSRGVAHWIGVDVPEPTSVRPSFVRCDVCGELTASRAVVARGYARHRKCVKHGERATYDRGCRCQECRDAKTALMREYVRMVKERDGRSPTQKYRPARGRVCDWCGRALTSAAGTAADGLMLCKPHRDEKRDRDRRNASRRRAFQRKIDNAAAGVPANPRWPFVQGVCRYCKESFVRRGQASPYCSSKCRRKDGPRKWITASARRSIYERDHWMCKLCF